MKKNNISKIIEKIVLKRKFAPDGLRKVLSKYSQLIIFHPTESYFKIYRIFVS